MEESPPKRPRGSIAEEMDELDAAVDAETAERERQEPAQPLAAAMAYADRRRGATEHDVLQAMAQNVEMAEGRTPSPHQPAPGPGAVAEAKFLQAQGRVSSRAPPADIGPPRPTASPAIRPSTPPIAPTESKQRVKRLPLRTLKLCEVPCK